MEREFMENNVTDIDKVWDLFVAHKQNVRVAVQVSPAVRVAIGEAFGLSRGEDALGKLVTALKTLGADLVVDGAIAYDVLAYDMAKEVQARIASGGALPLVYCRGVKADAAWREDASVAAYMAPVRPPMQALSVALKRSFLGDGKRTFVVAIMPCPCGKKIAESKGRRMGDLPATDIVLTTEELVDMLLSAGMHLKYLHASAADEPFGAPTGVGEISAITGGIAEGVMRYLGEEFSEEALRRIEYSGVRTIKGVREAEIAGKKVMVASSMEDGETIKNAIAAGECDAVFVEISGNPYGCIVGKSQATDEEMTKKLRAYGLYCIDKRGARCGGEQIIALSNAFAADCADDGFEELEVVLSPFAEEEIVEEAVETAAPMEEITEEAPVEEVVEETPVEEVAEEAPVEEVVEEAPVEEVVEEAPVEEVAEEAPVEEVVEEAPVEEVVEEAPVEEVVEETPVEEVAEETPVEEVVEETPVEEMPAEEAPIVEEIDGEDDEEGEEYEEITEEEYEAMTEEERMKSFDPNYRRMSRTQRRKMKRMRKIQK